MILNFQSHSSEAAITNTATYLGVRLSSKPEDVISLNYAMLLKSVKTKL